MNRSAICRSSFWLHWTPLNRADHRVVWLHCCIEEMRIESAIKSRFPLWTSWISLGVKKEPGMVKSQSDCCKNRSNSERITRYGARGDTWNAFSFFERIQRRIVSGFIFSSVAISSTVSISSGDFDTPISFQALTPWFYLPDSRALRRAIAL